MTLLLAVTGLGSATTYVMPSPEQVVEGHIVFTTIQSMSECCNHSKKAAAVAVLIREKQIERDLSRFPGVLWFTDQYLVDPLDAQGDRNESRYPCTGSVLAVNAGDPDPRLYSETTLRTNYIESYHIYDPNNHFWEVDKFNVSGFLVWSVNLNGEANGPSSREFPDDGNCNQSGAPFRDRGTAATNPSGYRYPCGGNGGPRCAKVQYNAVLIFMLDDLTVPGAGPKNHTDGSTDRLNDVSGCDDNGNGYFDDGWPCPAGDDDREGNSHDYNPNPTKPGNAERMTHGYSNDCTGDGVYDRNCHATRNVDIYYGVSPNIAMRNYAFYDHVGSTAPYHCHQPDAPYDFCT